MHKDCTEPCGPMSIAAPAVFGSRHIASGVAEFAAANPRLSIDLRLCERQADPVANGADICFRIGGLADSDYIATKVGRTRRVLCASPEYVERAGAPESPQMLVAHNCLVNSLYTTNSTWYFSQDGEVMPVRVKGSFTANNSECLRATALAGVGIGLLGTWSIDEDLKAGSLVELLSGWDGEVTKASRDIFILYRRADRNDPAKQALIAFFRKRFAETPSLRAAHQIVPVSDSAI
jgi:DNA-binding transcriptional LysR family regulator